MNIPRYLFSHIKDDLKEKMVFLGGPRQVGKTTLSQEYIDRPNQYLSWDDLEDREKIKKHQIDLDLKTVVFDEIHKYSRWRILVKALFDKYRDRLSVLVTGSARLDHFRKGGDSLVGRYHFYRLHPLTLPELDKENTADTLKRLIQFGGFPEPYKKQSESFSRRWRKERLSRVVYQDLRDLDTVKDLSKMELLVDALPERVGSILSNNSLGEDLEVSPNTIKRWIEVLEAVFYCYKIFPYGPPKVRAVKKSSKLYLWDWSEVPSAGPRFENMVASHLLKYCHFMEDTQGYKMELRFLRDIDSREIDFVVLKDKKPLFAVECKTGDKYVSPHLKYFRDRTSIPHFYQVHLGQKSFSEAHITVVPFKNFCKHVGLV